MMAQQFLLEAQSLQLSRQTKVQYSRTFNYY
jgi:hypothetical protein